MPSVSQQQNKCNLLFKRKQKSNTKQRLFKVRFSRVNLYKTQMYCHSKLRCFLEKHFNSKLTVNHLKPFTKTALFKTMNMISFSPKWIHCFLVGGLWNTVQTGQSNQTKSSNKTLKVLSKKKNCKITLWITMQ